MMKIIVLMAAFVAWLGSNSDLPMPERAPTVEIMAAERMWHILHPGQPFVPDQAEVLGLHIDGTGRILLSDAVDIDAPFGQSILLHELVHFYQDEAGIEFACMGQRERHAYQIQMRWLEQQGVDIWDHLDPLYAMFVWQLGCGGGRLPEGAR